MRDIDSTVHFMRDLLKHETTSRSSASSPGLSDPRLSANNSKDAKVYKHDDSSSAYKPSSRHLDRKSVRYAGEDPDADISDIRRQLQNTSMMLDRSAEDSSRKSAEDEQLEQEMDDLKYRVKRLQEDIDYVSKGRRSADKDEERRKLERELLFLMHEKLPELERRQKRREEEKAMEERAGIRARDRRNEDVGRFRDRDDDRSGGDWLKGSYDRDRERDRDRRDYDRDRRDRDRDDSYRRPRSRSRSTSRDRYKRAPSPPSTRSAPPAPSAPSADAAPPPAPAPPKSTKAAAPSTANMSPEQRKAFIRAQAQARIQERLKALGVDSGSGTSTPAEPAVDTSVQDRLEQEKKEAEEKSKKAEEEHKAREEARRRKMGVSEPESPAEKKHEQAAPASPAPLKSAMKKAPAPPPSNAPAPPTSRSAKAPPAPPVSRGAKAPPAPPVQEKKVEEEDPEEAEYRAKEEARNKAREERRARLAAMEKEEEEERKREEEMLAARKNRSMGASPAPPPAPASPAPTAANATSNGETPSKEKEASTAGTGGYNPFRKPSSGAAASPAQPTPTQGGGGFNPFFRPPAASPAAQPSSTSGAPPPPPPPPPPATSSPAPQAAYRPPPPAVEEDWEEIREKDDDSDSDSSDDDYATSRASRGALASALFGGQPCGEGGSRPGSGPGSPAPGSGPNSATTAKPPVNKAALAKLGGGAPSPGGGGMGALLGAIQGGARLKKTETVVKGAGTGGKVIGDAALPDHIRAGEPPVSAGEREDSAPPARAPSPPPMPRQSAPALESEHEQEEEENEEEYRKNDKRQSVDWYAGLAADQATGGGAGPAAAYAGGNTLDSHAEEEEKADVGAEGGGLDEFDMTKGASSVSSSFLYTSYLILIASWPSARGEGRNAQSPTSTIEGQRQELMSSNPCQVTLPLRRSARCRFVVCGECRHYRASRQGSQWGVVVWHDRQERREGVVPAFFRVRAWS